mgnify:CR=1 FL=1
MAGVALHYGPRGSQANTTNDGVEPCYGRRKAVYMRRVGQPDHTRVKWIRAGSLCERCLVFWPSLKPQP